MYTFSKYTCDVYGGIEAAPDLNTKSRYPYSVLIWTRNSVILLTGIAGMNSVIQYHWRGEQHDVARRVAQAATVWERLLDFQIRADIRPNGTGNLN